MRSALGSLLGLLLLLPLAARAQDTPPPFVEIVTMEVPLDEMATFDEAVTMVVQAAKQASLGAEWGWSFWQSENTYALVSELQSMGQLDDPEAWMRQFANTPGQATLMSAFQKMTGMHVRSSSSIMQTMPDWSYMPAGAPQPMWAEVLSYVPMMGTDEALDALAKEAIGVLRSAGFPYQVLAHRARAGDAVIQWVILYDDPAGFAAATAKLEANATWQALGPRWGAVLFDAESQRFRLRPDLSYQPGM